MMLRALEIGGPDGSRTLLTRFSNMVTAWDFWQQASTVHRFAHARTSTHVLSGRLESTSVVATLWQRSPRWSVIPQRPCNEVHRQISTSECARLFPSMPALSLIAWTCHHGSVNREAR